MSKQQLFVAFSAWPAEYVPIVSRISEAHALSATTKTKSTTKHSNVRERRGESSQLFPWRSEPSPTTMSSSSSTAAASNNCLLSPFLPRLCAPAAAACAAPSTMAVARAMSPPAGSFPCLSAGGPACSRSPALTQQYEINVVLRRPDTDTVCQCGLAVFAYDHDV
jgi:hypothetical protein